MVSLKNIYACAFTFMLLVATNACTAPQKNYSSVTEVTPYVRPPSIDAVLSKHAIAEANIGYLLQDLNTGEIISKRNADVAFIPASTAKVFTSYAALKVLGDDFRFETKLCAVGNSLYLVGGGDPSLEVEDLMAMAQKIPEYSDTYVHFYFDDSLYPRIDYVEETQPHEAYYNPPVSALGTKNALTLINWGAGESEGTVHLYQSPYINPSSTDVPTDWLLGLKSGSHGQARFPLKDPALHTAALFQLFAKRNGIVLPDAIRKQVPAGGCEYPLVVHESTPLRMIIGQLLESSSNVQAELIGLAIAKKLASTPDTLEQSAEILTRWIMQEFPDANWDNFKLSNHSGLSIETRITPAQMAEMLVKGGPNLVSLMPISGWKGWLKGRLKEPDVSLRIWAKTGAVNYGIGLAGYLYPKSETPMVFSIFVNDMDKRWDYDLLNEDDQISAGAKASQWNRNARNTIDDIARYWADLY